MSLSLLEFAKIKEKQKAWKVDNGLRVHEVTNSDQSPYVKHTCCPNLRVSKIKLGSRGDLSAVVLNLAIIIN